MRILQEVVLGVAVVYFRGFEAYTSSGRLNKGGIDI